jgi:NAD(P)-dependent dehydrogenase (short-subunit alcohol dehydrogenase family)
MLVHDLTAAGWKVYAGCTSRAVLKSFDAVGFAQRGAARAKEAPAGEVGRVVPLLLDVTNLETVTAAAARIGADHPETGLFALVHTAVSMQGGMAEWLSPEQFRRTSEVRPCAPRPPICWQR